MANSDISDKALDAISAAINPDTKKSAAEAGSQVTCYIEHLHQVHPDAPREEAASTTSLDGFLSPTESEELKRLTKDSNDRFFALSDEAVTAAKNLGIQSPDGNDRAFGQALARRLLENGRDACAPLTASNLPNGRTGSNIAMLKGAADIAPAKQIISNEHIPPERKPTDFKI